MHVQVLPVGGEGLRHHARAQIRAADADVHHVADGQSGAARVRAVLQAFGEIEGAV